MKPLRCVADTNVLIVANGRNDEVSARCAAACAAALQRVMQDGHLFLDSAGHIIDEYRRNLQPFGEPRAGNAFFKWLLTHQHMPGRVTHVEVTPVDDPRQGFAEIPVPNASAQYDLADLKFLAVSAAHPEHPPILQATDSKWLDWVSSLEAAGIEVRFLCRQDARAARRRKAKA